MALHNELPVHKVCYDLLVDIFACIKDCNREYKYSLGETIKQRVIGVLENIYRANSVYEKTPHLLAAREDLEMVRILLRILKDMHQITTTKFIGLNQQIESISKQLLAWQRSTPNATESV